ncbi:kinase-like domain-containing protein [Sparassis latifolia]
MAESLPNVAGYPTDSQLLDNVESSCTLLLPQTPTSYTLQRTHRLDGNGADLDLICPPAFLDDATELLEHANTHCAEDSIHDSEDFPSLQQTHAESTSESICDKAYPSVVTPLDKLEGTVFSDFRMIGRGGFGRVVLAQRLQQVGEESVQDYVAIKVVRKRAPFRSPDWRQKLLTEKEIMQRVTLQTCPSPFLMNLLSSWADESNVYFVMKYCPMSLDDRLQDLRAAGRCMGVQEAKLCCAELILGLSHLHHEVKIIHRDIKPQNILINRDGTYLYADFGLAFDPKKRNLCASSVYKAAGTDGYSAPEVCDPKVHIFGYGHKADVFSLGLVLAEVFGADTPLYQHCSKWTAQDKLNKATGVIFDQWEWMRREPVLDKLANLQIDPLAKGLLEKMLQTRCSQRASAKDLMKDPYFHDVDWGRVLNSQYRHPFKPVMPTLDRYLKTNLAFRSSLGDICSINYPSHEELKINSVDDAHASSGSEEGNDDCDFLFDYSQGDNFTSPTVDAMHEIYEIPFNAA